VETARMANQKMHHHMVTNYLVYSSTDALIDAKKEVYVEVNYEKNACWYLISRMQVKTIT
jgi:hypothetical protein